MMLLLKNTKIIHIISVGILISGLVLSGFSIMKIWELEGANKDFENKIKTLTNNENNMKKRVTNLEDDLDTLRSDFDDYSHY
ncbi:hypothetical protein [Desulfosporosinus metallidurans]|nr:hypothetical protein [Desulfosporosinus metallidurans]